MELWDFNAWKYLQYIQLESVGDAVNVSCFHKKEFYVSFSWYDKKKNIEIHGHSLCINAIVSLYLLWIVIIQNLSYLNQF